MKRTIFLGLLCITLPANAVVQCVSTTNWIRNRYTDFYKSDWQEALDGIPNGKIHVMATCTNSDLYEHGRPLQTSLGTDTSDFKACVCMRLYPGRTDWLYAYKFSSQADCWQYCSGYCHDHPENVSLFSTPTTY